MTRHPPIHHHPGAEILTAYAMGALHAGGMLAVACHLDRCALCRHEAGLWESAGGALLEAAEAEPLSADALQKTLARLDADNPPPAPPLPRFLERFDIPPSLKERRIGRRRFVTPGIWFAPVHAGSGEAGGAHDAPMRTYLVYAKPGTVLAEHTHHGCEFTQVLAGSFADPGATYGEGDFAVCDGRVLHAPAVTRDRECLCLISADAPMRLSGLPARLLQRLMGTPY